MLDAGKSELPDERAMLLLAAMTVAGLVLLPSRRARSATCAPLSSPVTYSVFFSRDSASSACSSSVLLPMPGSPPISTTPPGTMPPPSTRSSSSCPVGVRSTSAASRSTTARPTTPGWTSRRPWAPRWSPSRPFDSDRWLAQGDQVTLGVRPEHLRPGAEGELQGEVMVEVNNSRNQQLKTPYPISFKRLETVEEELQVGQMVEVKLIEIDEKTGK